MSGNITNSPSLYEYSAEVQKNENIFKSLLITNKLHHAWLITGSPSFDNVCRLVAIILFPDLNIDEALKKLNSGSCINFMCIRKGANKNDKNYNKLSIGIDQIREGIKFLTFKGDKLNRRVLLIDSLDELSRIAPHTLLKTTEEPSSGSFLLMVCKQPRRILPTLRSRCQIITYPNYCFEIFQKDNIRKFDNETLQLIWWLTNGKIQDSMAVIKISGFLIYLEEILKWFINPKMIKNSSSRKLLKSIEFSCSLYDREQKISNPKGCFMFIFTSIYQILLTACISKYDKSLINRIPSKAKLLVNDACQSIENIIPEFQSAFIDECWKIMQKSDKSMLNIPGIFCLQEVIATIEHPNKIIKNSILAN